MFRNFKPCKVRNDLQSLWYLYVPLLPASGKRSIPAKFWSATLCILRTERLRALKIKLKKRQSFHKFSLFFQFAALPSLLLHPFTTDKTGQQVQSDWKILHKWSWTVWEFSSCSITAHPKHFNKLLWFQQMPAFGFMCSSDSSLTKDWPFIQFQ